MASSSSETTDCIIYDVFLSFRGEDTRYTFMDHLYAALVQAGIRTFRDDEIETGGNLWIQLADAIGKSRASIVVLSEGYASSTWCLDELVMILEQSTTSGHTVIPIFYHVDPSDVRKQKNSFSLDEMMEGRKELGEIRMEQWKAALTAVADLAGKHLKIPADRHESKFIQEIVREINEKLDRKVLSTPRCLVGMYSRVKDINSWFKHRSSGVNILAICGMGGIGKTTMAKYIYNMNFRRFESRSFLADIREISKEANGLVGLQKQLLANVQKGPQVSIYNTHEGTPMIENALCSKKVLVVLDDIDNANQLETLLGTPRLHPGSTIIITTRDKSLPKIWGKYKEITLEKLNDDESLELLSWHAFQEDHPEEGYEEQSKEIVQYCGGIPLALKVLGSSLCGESRIDVWKSTLGLLEKGNHCEIQNVLRISFDSLPFDGYKSLFLHIACFFVGKDKDDTEMECGSTAIAGIQSLINRCFLTIGPNNKLMMHQLLQTMAKEIICEESRAPWKSSIMWCNEDSVDLLAEKEGIAAVESLLLDMKEDKFKDSHHTVDLETCAFSRMKKLKRLQLNYVQLIGGYENFPKKLKWLCWHGFSSRSMPMDLPLKNLVSLDMSFSKLEQVWTSREPAALGSLKILDLSCSYWLTEILNFSRFPNLERLILASCLSLLEIGESIGALERLHSVDLSQCRYLRKLPRNFGKLRLLTLDLSGCQTLELIYSLPVTVKHLYMHGCKLLENRELPSYLFVRAQRYSYFHDFCPRSQGFQQLIEMCARTFLSAGELIKAIKDFDDEVIHTLGWSRLGLPQNLELYRDDSAWFSRDFSPERMSPERMFNEITEKCPIQVSYDSGVFSAFFTESEVPSGFDYKSKGSSISFTVPRSHMIRGLNVCSIYTCSNLVSQYSTQPLSAKLSNATKNLTWIYYPQRYQYPVSIDEDIVWLSHWIFGNKLNDGDEVIVSIVVEKNWKVRECGFGFVYYDEEEEKEFKEFQESAKYMEMWPVRSLVLEPEISRLEIDNPPCVPSVPEQKVQFSKKLKFIINKFSFWTTHEVSFSIDGEDKGDKMKRNDSSKYGDGDDRH